nr:YqjK family protein [uncultured Albidiferax sp.]
MAKTRIELAQQRAQLVERIAAQRVLLAHDLAPLQRVGQAGNRVSNLVGDVVAYLGQHPLALAAALGSLMLFKPRSALRWAKRGLFLWRSWRAVQIWQPAMLLGLLRRFI